MSDKANQKKFSIAVLLIAAVVAAGALVACRSELRQRDIVILTPDGFKLAATVFQAGSSGVVIANDEGSTKSFAAPLAHFLAQQGYTVMTFNFRGYEGSEGVPDPSLMDRDVVGAATSLVRNFGAREVTYVGFGTGALIAAKAATNLDFTPRAVVLTGLPESYGSLEAGKVLPPLFLPKLFMVPSGDDAIIAKTQELMKFAPNPKELHVYPADENWFDPSTAVRMADSGIARMVDFLRRVQR